MYFREKQKEKDREELWQRLEKLEVNHGADSNRESDGKMENSGDKGEQIYVRTDVVSART